MNLQPEDIEIDVEDPAAASSTTDLAGKGEPAAALPREAKPTTLGLASGKSSVAPTLQDVEEKNEPVHNERNKNKRTLTEQERKSRACCFIFVASVLAIGIVGAAVRFLKEPNMDRGRLTSSDDGGTWAPESECPFDFPKEETLIPSAGFPETDLEKSLYDFALTLSSAESLTNTSSPQFQAYRSLVGMYQNEEEVPEWNTSIYDLTQRYVLNVFFHSSEGSTPEDEQESSIHVACEVNSNNEMVELELSPPGRVLEGLPLMRIPTEIAHLSALYSLSLLRSVKGTIPSELGQLTALKLLWLPTNALTGTIPSELGQLTAMTKLNLSHNGMTGPIPSELGQLTGMRWLDMGGNSLTGPIPSELGQLTEIRELYLSFNALTGPIPSELGQLTKTAYLYLNDNALTGPIPSELGQLTSMLYRDLDGNTLSGPWKS